MEQAQGAKTPEQVEAWGKAAEAAVRVPKRLQTNAGTVSAQAAEKKPPTSAEIPASISNAPSAGQP